MTQETIATELQEALLFLTQEGHVKKGSQIVIGCSTSEVTGGKIGKNSAPEVGEWIAHAVIEFCEKENYQPVFQCCEHLNRSLVMDAAEAEKSRYTVVCAIPQPKAGGSVPSAAFKKLKHSVLVQHVQASAGIDIGDTLIGMHLKSVAVPLRFKTNKIGEANLVMAYTRPPFVGGCRAVYPE